MARTATGIDISDVAIEKGRERARQKGFTNVRLEAMNAEAMTFPDDSFDLVFGSGIIHHLDIDRAFGEIARVLRPGGRAVFIEPLGLGRKGVRWGKGVSVRESLGGGSDM